MGNRRRVLRGMKQQVALVDTHIVANDCQVLLGHPDPAHAKKAAKEFAGILSIAVSRAKCVNMSDIYNGMYEVQKKIEAGIPLWN